MFDPARLRIDRIDAQIIHALQIWPRVPWATLGTLLNLDPITVARRWGQLTENGIAWLTAYTIQPGSDASHAIIDLQVKPKNLEQVLRDLTELREIATVRFTLGDWGLSVDWHGERIETLERFIHTKLATIQGVRAVRSFLVTQAPVEGSSWRLSALSEEQERVLERTARRDLMETPSGAGRHPIDRELIELIREDGRMSLTLLARRADSSVNTVKRHLGHLLRSREVIVRCEISRQLSGLPVTAKFLASVRSEEVADVTARLSRMPEVRSCVVLLGKYNLMINAWLGSVRDVAIFEAKLGELVPELVVEERDLVTGFRKLMWTKLDASGRKLSGYVAE